MLLVSLTHLQVDTTAAFLKCKMAYEILSDAQRRREYDQQLSQQQVLNTQVGTPRAVQDAECTPFMLTCCACEAALPPVGLT